MGHHGWVFAGLAGGDKAGKCWSRIARASTGGTGAVPSVFRILGRHGGHPSRSDCRHLLCFARTAGANATGAGAINLRGGIAARCRPDGYLVRRGTRWHRGRDLYPGALRGAGGSLTADADGVAWSQSPAAVLRRRGRPLQSAAPALGIRPHFRGRKRLL